MLKVNGGSVSLPTGLTISGVRTPTSDSEAANKQYVDTQLSTKLTTPTGTAGQLLGFTADNTVDIRCTRQELYDAMHKV